MKRLVPAIMLAGALVACSPKTETQEPAAEPAPPAVAEIAALPDPAGACAAKATYEWSAAGGRYAVTGAAAGATCNTGEAVVTVRDAATGKVLLSSGGFDVGVMSNTVFAEAKTPETLKDALSDWITQRDVTETSATLPEWKAGDDQPIRGEFPFYPEEGVTREAWAALRAANQPMFCHVQGMESAACYLLDPAAQTLTKIGVQSFPG
jgi:hypothetical protein